MGLPRDVSSGATCVGFTAAHYCALTIPTMLYHTPTMHRGVKADVHSGRWPRLPGFLQLGGCSSISIALLLVSQEIPGSVHESLHTQPIHFMGREVTAIAECPPESTKFYTPPGEEESAERTYSVATASPPHLPGTTCRTCVSAIGLPVTQSTGSSIARGERDVAR